MLLGWHGTSCGLMNGPLTWMNLCRFLRRMLSVPAFSPNSVMLIPARSLVDLFSTPDLVPNINTIRRHLLTYYSLLESTHLTNAVLSSLPLPATLDPRQPVPLPSRLLTLSILIRDTMALIVHLPFSILPLVIHAPAYVMGRIGARLVEDEEETQAQNKVVFGLLLLLVVYSAAFFFVWAFLWYTPVGALVALAFVFLFAMYHNRLINGEPLTSPVSPALSDISVTSHR